VLEEIAGALEALHRSAKKPTDRPVGRESQA
jgi:hypothetical protein